jgi:hypothetical protein
MKLTHEQKEKARDELRKFLGLPPYNTPANPDVHDAYFSHAIEVRYGMSINELMDLVNIHA